MPDILLSVGYQFQSLNQGIASIVSQAQRGFQPLGKITGAANEFRKSLEASNARVIAFGASAGALFALRSAFTKLVTSAIEVETHLTEINALLQVSTKDLGRFSTELFRVANATGTSFSDAAKAAQEFARQGLSVEQTLQRTKSALTLTRLSGLALEDSVSSLTAALNSFGKEALTDIEIVNRLANVDAKFAVSSADLAEALKRVSGSASDAGLEFNKVISLVTAAQQATARGGSVIGNSFKTIFTRLQRPQVLEDLETAGVQVRNLNGEALDLVSVLKNLANSYDSLSSGQKSFVAETVGGVYQINVLKSILNDLGSGFSTYDRALKVAGDSSSVADRRLNELNNTISSRLVQTMNTLTQATSTAGDALFGQTIRSGLSGFEKILNVKEKLNQLLGGSESEGIGSFVGASLGKGISNILSGPAIQFAVFGLIKLFQRLASFAIDSLKDLTGINQKEKEREAINKLVVDQLSKQKTLIYELSAGTKSIADVTNIMFNDLKASNKEWALMATYVPALTKSLVTRGTSGFPVSKASSGYIPSLDAASSEIKGARAAGYVPGNVISTTVRDGMRSIPIIANSAESRTSVNVDGKSYDFINPPKNSMAGRIHAMRAKQKTGIDPYASMGFVPNLALGDDLGDKLNQNIGDLIRGMKNKANEMVMARNVSKFAYRFIDTTPEIQSRRKDRSWGMDKEFLASALTNKVLTDKVDPYDLEVVKKMGISDSLFEVLAQGFSRKINVGELRQRVSKGEFARGFIPNLSTELSREDAEKMGLKLNNPTKKVYILDINDNPADFEGKGTQAFYRTKDAITLASKTVESLHAGDGGIMSRIWRDDGGYLSVSSAPATFNAKIRANEFGGRYTVSKSGVQGARDTTELGQLAIKQFRDVSGRTAQVAAATDDERNYKFDMDDVRAMLNLRGREFSGLFAFENFANKTPLSKSGETVGRATVAGENVTVPFRFAGLKNPEKVYSAFSKSYQAGLQEAEAAIFGESSGSQSVTNEGQSFGNFFDSLIKRKAKQLGLNIGENVNENLDIIGFNPKLSSIFNSQTPFAAADAKGGFNQEAFDSIAEKIVRVLAFKKGAGDVTTPVFSNVSKFTGKNAGIFSSDKFVTPDGKKDTEAFGVALYKALSTGKPFRTNIGSTRSPDGISAAKIFQESSRLGKYITSVADVAKYDEYVLISASKIAESTSKELLGLSIGSSSDVYGYKSSDPSKEEHADVFKVLQQRLGNRFKFAAKGIVPNLSAIQNALYRENVATGGNAMLDYDPSLMSSQNPFGFAAVDKKTQGSAKEAIKQHKMLGQSMSYIKGAGASKGYVPNLAVDDSSSFLLSAILASGQSVLGGELPGIFGKFQKSLNGFISQFDDFNKKTAREQKEWLESIEMAKKDLRLGGKNGGKDSVDVRFNPKVSGTRTFTRAEDIDSAFGKRIEVIGNRLKAFDATLEDERSKIRRLGFLSSFGGALAGGVASQAAAKFSPDASKAVDEFVSSVQLGGQFMATFPNKVGKAIGVFSIFSGVSSAADTLIKGLEGTKKQYETQLSQSQKMTAYFDQLSQSLSNLDTMVLDSTVTIETLTKEQRKFNEAISMLAQLGPEGQNLSNRIQQSPDTKGKLSELQKARDIINKRNEASASGLQIKELASERTAFGKFASLSGGIFGFRTEIEKSRSNQVLQSSVFSAISNITNTKEDPQKDSLVALVGDFKKFSEAVVKNETTGSFIKSIKDVGGTENDVNLFINQLRKTLSTEAVSSNPQVIGARAKALKANESAQFNVDSAAKNELSLRRLFLNIGSLQGQNSLNERKLASRGAIGNFEIAESSQKGQAARLAQIFGEETVAAFESQIAVSRIQAERTQKVSDAGGQLSKSLLDIFSQPLEGFVKATDTGKGPESISQLKQNLIEAINNGLSGTIGQGNLDRFIDSNGQLDFESFKQDIINNSGATSEDTINKLSQFLNSNKSNLDVLKSIQQGNNEIVEINQDSLKELRLQSAKLDNLRKEMDVRRQANFLGGSRALTDRNFRREVNRQFIRGARLMETGQTAETRGRGALTILEAAKQYGLNPLTVASQNQETGLYSGRGDKFSDSVAKALNIAVNGLKTVQIGQENRINNSIARFGENSDSSNIFESITRGALRESAAGVGVGATVKPEGDTIIQQAMSALKDSTFSVNGELEIAIGKLKGFSTALENVKDNLFGNEAKNIRGAVNETKDAQESAKITRETVDRDYVAVVQETLNKLGISPQAQVATQKGLDENRNRFNVSDAISGGTGVLGALLGFYGIKKLGKGAGSLLDKGKGFGSSALDAVINEYGGAPNKNRPTISGPATAGSNPNAYKEFNRVLAEKERLRKPFGPPPGDMGRGLRDRLVLTSENTRPVLGTPNNRYLVTPPSQTRPNISNPRGGYGMPKFGFAANPVGGGGMLGGMVLGNIAQRVTGDTSGGAYIAGSYAASSLTGLGGAFAAPTLGGAGGAFAASPAAVLLAGAGAAYGGYKAGGAIFRGANKDLFANVGEGIDDSTRGAYDLVKSDIEKGKKSSDIKKRIDAQINTTQQQIKEIGGGGVWTSLLHMGKEAEQLKNSIEKLKQLRDSIDAIKAQKDEEKAQKEYQDKMIEALNNLSGGGGDKNTNISIEISLRDADKLPQIFNEKIIKPLEQQLKGLQTRTYNIEQSVGIGPQPAGI